MNSYLINNKSDFKQILASAIEECRLLKEQFPNLKIYTIVYEQLLYINQIIVIEKRSPTNKEGELIQIGPIAVKNFEDDNEEFTKKLSELDYCFCNYDTFESDEE
jgi:hypothetical protein